MLANTSQMFCFIRNRLVHLFLLCGSLVPCRRLQEAKDLIFVSWAFRRYLDIQLTGRLKFSILSYLMQFFWVQFLGSIFEACCAVVFFRISKTVQPILSSYMQNSVLDFSYAKISEDFAKCFCPETVWSFAFKLLETAETSLYTM